MNSSRLTRVTLLLGLVLLLALAAGASAQGNGSGQARWAALGLSGVTPDDITRANDAIVAAFSGSGAIGTNCFDPSQNAVYTPGDAVFYVPVGDLCWLPWFDATNSGLRANVDINAMQDECSNSDPFCDMYLSFKNDTRIDGIGAVKPQDIVVGSWVFLTVDTYDNWWKYFDGSDVGLSTSTEGIDALYIFDPGEEPAELGCAQLLLISTAGNYRVPDTWGNNLSGGGEDVLGFCASWLGPDTAGYWFVYHDGSAEGAPKNAIIGLDHQDGRPAFARFEFLTKGPFHVDSAHGNHSMVYNYFGQSSEYAGPTLDFGDIGATDKVDSFSVHHVEN